MVLDDNTNDSGYMHQKDILVSYLTTNEVKCNSVAFCIMLFWMFVSSLLQTDCIVSRTIWASNILSIPWCKENNKKRRFMQYVDLAPPFFLFHLEYEYIFVIELTNLRLSIYVNISLININWGSEFPMFFVS